MSDEQMERLTILWADIVGADLARYSAPIDLFDGGTTLLIGAYGSGRLQIPKYTGNEIAQQLGFLGEHILEKVRPHIDGIAKLRFRVTKTPLGESPERVVPAAQ